MSRPNIVRKYVVAGIFLLVGMVRVVAQTDDEMPVKILYPEDSIAVMEGKALPDTAADATLKKLVTQTKHSLLKEQERKQAKKDWTKWKPNPKKATWLAIALPGAGQIYNRKYWKIPLFYGGIAGCIYAWTWNNQMYTDYSNAYVDIMDDDPTTQRYADFLHLGATITDESLSYYQNLFKRRKDRYRRWRDMSIFATIGVYLLSVIDAYVDASLSDFDISNDLSLRISPVMFNTGTTENNRFSFGETALGVGCTLTF